MLTTLRNPLMFTCCVTFHICRKNTRDDRTSLQENQCRLQSLTTFPLLLHFHLKKTEITEKFVTKLMKEIAIITLQKKFFSSSPWQTMCLVFKLADLLFFFAGAARQLTKRIEKALSPTLRVWKIVTLNPKLFKLWNRELQTAYYNNMRKNI